jgi:hypothetical protein
LLSVGNPYIAIASTTSTVASVRALRPISRVTLAATPKAMSVDHAADLRQCRGIDAPKNRRGYDPCEHDKPD